MTDPIVTREMIDAGLEVSPMWLCALDPQTGIHYPIPPSAHIRQRASLNSDDLTVIYQAMAAAAVPEPEPTPETVGKIQWLKAIGMCADEARRIGNAWAEDTPDPDTSRQVGAHIADALSHLEDGPVVQPISVEDRERYYDLEIAPVLKALSARCKRAGLSFVASVEWAPGESGSTVTLQDTVGWPTRTAAVAAASGGNADLVILDIMERARITGHSSACLHTLGVPVAGTPASPS